MLIVIFSYPSTWLTSFLVAYRVFIYVLSGTVFGRGRCAKVTIGQGRGANCALIFICGEVQLPAMVSLGSLDVKQKNMMMV